MYNEVTRNRIHNNGHFRLNSIELKCLSTKAVLIFITVFSVLFFSNLSQTSENLVTYTSFNTITHKDSSTTTLITLWPMQNGCSLRLSLKIFSQHCSKILYPDNFINMKIGVQNFSLAHLNYQKPSLSTHSSTN